MNKNSAVYILFTGHIFEIKFQNILLISKQICQEMILTETSWWGKKEKQNDTGMQDFFSSCSVTFEKYVHVHDDLISCLYISLAKI